MNVMQNLIFRNDEVDMGTLSWSFENDKIWRYIQVPFE